MGYNKAKINLPRPPLPFFFLGERAVLLPLASSHAGQPWPLRNKLPLPNTQGLPMWMLTFYSMELTCLRPVTVGSSEMTAPMITMPEDPKVCVMTCF